MCYNTIRRRMFAHGKLVRAVFGDNSQTESVTMKTKNWFAIGCGVVLALNAPAAGLDTNQIQQITGLKGTLNKEEGVFKVSAPRNDLKVSVDGWTTPPFMGLTSWAAFTEGKKEMAMVMGDIVLFQDEVNPVMTAALDNGLSVTALHNHFFFD